MRLATYLPSNSSPKTVAVAQIIAYIRNFQSHELNSTYNIVNFAELLFVFSYLNARGCVSTSSTTEPA